MLLDKRIKKRLSNNQICLSEEWLNNVLNKNYEKYEKYNCIIVKKSDINDMNDMNDTNDINDINDMNLINFINKNDKKIRIRNLFFLKDYTYLKIVKGKDIIAFVCLKSHDLFIKDNLNFKRYNSILIDYICTDNYTYNNDDVIYCDEFESESIIGQRDIINISIKEFIKEFIKEQTSSCFIYNTDKKNEKNEINERLLCKKTLYYRPIYINRLINCNIFTVDDDKLLKKIYNTFSYHVSFLNNIKIEFFRTNVDNTELLASTLSDLLINYNKKNLQVFEYIDKNKMCDILKDPLFYKFIIRDKNKEITDFVCIQSYYIINNCNLNNYCKNGSYYCSFYSKNSAYHISYILEVISEYSYKNDIFDIITLNDFFSEEESNYFKIIKKCTKYYYINNIEPSFIIHSNKNGLPSIFN